MKIPHLVLAEDIFLQGSFGLVAGMLPFQAISELVYSVEKQNKFPVSIPGFYGERILDKLLNSSFSLLVLL